MKYEHQLETINLELTTACPLRCPQCYCSLEGGKHLDFETAKMRVDEASSLGAKILLLSGGETLCYPYLIPLIEYASGRIPEIRVALSGWKFDQNTYEKLTASGVTEISISLNASTEELNRITRDGYTYSIEALKLLQKNHYQHTMINWVMHSSNADDFGNIVRLAEQYDVCGILVIGVKPDSNNTLQSYPSREQMIGLSRKIKAYTGKVRILIESCFSNLLAFHSETRLFGNLNVSKYKGCGAGRNGISVDVDGRLTPCRHITAVEDIQPMAEYWQNSKYLFILRHMEDDVKEPCSQCKYKPYCLHCAAINWQTKGSIQVGFDHCPLFDQAVPKQCVSNTTEVAGKSL